MHKKNFAMAVMAAVALLSSEASAATVSIKPVSFNSLANSCQAAGGQSWGSAGGAYGCTKNNCDGKGGTCGVQCDKGKCHGVTPIVAGNAPKPTVSGTPKAFARSDLEQVVTREFCEICGTHIATRRPGLNAVILKAGTLDDPGLFGAPQMAIDAVDRQAFHIIPESLPIHERLPPR